MRQLLGLAITVYLTLGMIAVAQDSVPKTGSAPEGGDPQRSQNVPNTAELMRSFHSIHVQPATWLSKPEMCEGELQRRREFYEWNLVILKGSGADTELKIDHQPGWFYYPFSLTHTATGVVLISGTVNAWDGKKACSHVAEEVIKRLALVRPLPNEPGGKKK